MSPEARRQHRHAIFLDRARIDRGFVDDDIALLQHAANGLRRRQHGAQIGPVRVVDRRRHGHDIEIRRGKIHRIAAIAQCRVCEIVWLDFARPIMARLQLGNPLAINIKADNRHAGSRKSNSYRQADIPQPDDCDRSPVRHDYVP